MPKLGTQTFDLMPEGDYILQLKHFEDPEPSTYNGEPQIQMAADLEVVEALFDWKPEFANDTYESLDDLIGAPFRECFALDPKQGTVKKGSKLWLVYEAATGMKLDDDDEIDTDDILEKPFQAKVVINNPGTRNRTEHETYKKVKKDKAGKIQNRAEKEAKQVEVEAADEEDFEQLPF